MGFGQRLNAILLAKDITPAQLSKTLGWNTGALSQYLNSPTREPKLSNALKIAEALDISLDYLAGREGYGERGRLGPSPVLAADEAVLVGDYRRMEPEERETIARTAHAFALAGEAKKEGVAEPARVDGSLK